MPALRPHDAAGGLPPAVVIGLGTVTGLQSARILAARGAPVTGLATDLGHFATRTRVCERRVRSDVQDPGLIDDLLRLADELGREAVLVPCTDQAVLTVSRHRARLAGCYRALLPPDDMVRRLVDKAAFHLLASEHVLPVPRTYLVGSRSDAECAARELRFPALLKPSFKTMQWKRHTSIKALRVDDAGALLSAYDRLGPWAETLLAQEYVSGGDDQLHTCNVVYGRDSARLAEFVTRKRRQWPVGVGTASYAEAVLDDEVLAETRRLFDGIGFVGLGYLEVKRDADTGQLTLIEANIGRPTGRSATAEAGGVELLWTAYCAAAGLPLPPVSQRTQSDAPVTWIDLRRDVLSSVQLWRDGELGVADWWESMRRPKVHAVWSRDDPLPAAYEVVQSALQAGRRTVRRWLPAEPPTPVSADGPAAPSLATVT